ncbi:MAG: cobalamin B12-binding domain-containing protein [Planctomycetes bacterium]|nr:cobalamin B12-binding domain-containing protein [Planctomycetota bacterium]MBI3833677.1 cobalamin B12-binding domain-containing protein [Planctomycetota bacterium]
MPVSPQLEEYTSNLLAGNRPVCRRIINDLRQTMKTTDSIYHDLIWPAIERIEKLHRADRINLAAEHMATRINRAIADQLQTGLSMSPATGRKVVITCADGEPEELGAQICADLFESRGWEVFFLGGGVPNDEILNLVGQIRPDLLLIFGTQPGGVPGVRRLVDMIRDIGVNPTMNIMVSGGVFNRADALWKEVNADLMARTAEQVIPMAEAAAPRVPAPPKPGVPKKRRRRRRSAELVPAGA